MGVWINTFTGNEVSHKKSDKYLHINNCGYYQEINLLEVKNGSFRPNGLPDYQIIYLTQGSMNHLVAGENRILSAGDIIIYPPDTVQKYRCISGVDTSYIWVHFTGTAVEEILSSVGFKAEKIYHAEPNNAVYNYMRLMSDEMRFKRKGSELRANSVFLDLLSFLSRALIVEKSSGKKYSKIIPALRDMEVTPEKHRTNEEYAAMCGVDTYYFIHLFKEITGMPPIKYISEINLRKALCILSDTDLEIRKISEMLGFESASYFARRFKNMYGITPSQYRISCCEKKETSGEEKVYPSV